MKNLIKFIVLALIGWIIADKLSQIITMDQIMTVTYMILGINVISFIKDLRKED